MTVRGVFLLIRLTHCKEWWYAVVLLDPSELDVVKAIRFHRINGGSAYSIGHVEVYRSSAVQPRCEAARQGPIPTPAVVALARPRGIDPTGKNMVVLGMPSGATMPDDMRTFRVDVRIGNPARPGSRRSLKNVLVDTGAELSWVPADLLESLGVERNNRWNFRQADGSVLERWTGIVVISVAGRRTGDDVVFGEPGDLALLGSRTLEGLNFRVEPVHKRLVDAGPAPAVGLLAT